MWLTVSTNTWGTVLQAQGFRAHSWSLHSPQDYTELGDHGAWQMLVHAKRSLPFVSFQKCSISGFPLSFVYSLMVSSPDFLSHLPFLVAMYLRFYFRFLEMLGCSVCLYYLDMLHEMIINIYLFDNIFSKYKKWSRLVFKKQSQQHKYLNWRPYFVKNKVNKMSTKTGRLTQVVEHLPTKFKTMSSNPTPKKRKKSQPNCYYIRIMTKSLEIKLNFRDNNK
jgi:hypothetical protein